MRPPCRTTPAAGAATLAGLLLCGCGGPPPARRAADEAKAPRRVVCASPAVTEIVFALGCGERVVGVSDYTVYPPAAADRPSIGGWVNPNRERLLILDPEIIISQGRHEALAAFCEEYGIRFQAVELDCLEDVFAAVAKIASALGAPEAGVRLCGQLRGSLRAVSAAAAGGPPVPVALLLGRSPGSLAGLSTVGPGTFLDDLLELAGGSNVFADAAGLYPRISKESLLVRRPEVIVELHPGGLRQQDLARLRDDWRRLGNLPAVERDRVHFLTNDFLLIPGPRLSRTAGAIAAALHPAAADR